MTDKVSIRFDPVINGLVLFFINSNPRGWWLECFTKREGHSEAARSYMWSLKPITEAQRADAQALADFWASIPGGASGAVLVTRLSGPRLSTYVGR
jgi:hypothetical protein